MVSESPERTSGCHRSGGTTGSDRLSGGRLSAFQAASQELKTSSSGRNLMGDPAASDAAPQHLMALRRANEVRLARAELKRRIGSQELSAASVVLGCPWEADSMEISDILMSQRRWGRARCR